MEENTNKEENKIPLINAFNPSDNYKEENLNNLINSENKYHKEKQRIINKYSSKNDSYLNASFISKLLFCWAFKAIKVITNIYYYNRILM